MARRSFLDLLIERRAAALLAFLPAAVDGEVEAVHRARVASRRLRETLPPLAALLSGDRVEPVRDAVRRVTRALGPVRELDVTLALFDEVAGLHSLEATAREAVRASLESARRHARRRLRRTLPPARRAVLAEALASLHGPWPAGASARLSAEVRRRARRRAGRVLVAAHRSGALYAPEPLHEVRIAVKQLRYALELAGELGRRGPSPRVARLRAVQDRLGHAHDLHVLAERVRAVQIGQVRRHPRTATALGRFAVQLDRLARRDHAAFLAQRPALLVMCEALTGRAPARRRPAARRRR